MGREKKSQEQLVRDLRQQVAALEKAQAEGAQAEKALRESVAMYHTLVEQSLAGIYLFTRNRFVYVNETLAKTFGYRVDELIKGVQPLELVHPDDRPLVAENIRKRLSGEVETLDYTFRGLHKDGTTIYCRVFGRQVHYQGKPTILSVLLNITEQVQAEQRIEHLNTVLRAIRSVNQLLTREQNRERLLQGICDSLIATRAYYNAWIAVLDEPGGLAATAEAGLGEKFLPLVELLNRRGLPLCGQMAMRQSGTVTIEDPRSTCIECPLSSMYENRGAIAIRLEHGDKIYGLLTASIPKEYLADEQERSLFEGVAEDIAFGLHDIEVEEERKQAQEELRQSEQRYRSLVETAVDAIFTVATDGTITSLNPAFETITGWSCREWLGKPFTLIIHPDDLPLAEEVFQRALQGEAPPLYELRLLAKSGEHLVGEFKVTPQIQAGKVVGVLGVGRDITTRKRLEDRLSAIYSLGHKLVLSLDVENIAQSVVDAVKQVLHIPICGLWLVDEQQKVLVRLAHTAGAEAPEVLPLPLDEGQSIMSAVARSGEPIYLSDVRQDPRYIDRGFHSRSELCVPLTVGSKLIGALNMESKELDAFDETDRQLLFTLADQAALAIRTAQLFENLQKNLEGTVKVLEATVERRDPYTAGHQQRVTQLAEAIAREMGLPEEQIEGIHMAGLIHDIGKIAVPAEILSKPSKLNEMEMDLIRAHPQVGYDILKGIDFPWPVADIVLQHHERLDGSGYPQGLKGDEILLEARILAVADVVEAMASHRPYRPALGIDKALAEIEKNKGRLYDPAVVAACLELFTKKGFTFD